MSLPAGQGPLLSGRTTPREIHSLTTSPIPTPNRTPSHSESMSPLGMKTNRGPRKYKLSEIGEEEGETGKTPKTRPLSPAVINDGRTRGERASGLGGERVSRQEFVGTATPPSRSRSRDDLAVPREKEHHPDTPLRSRTSPKVRRHSRVAPDVIKDLKDLTASELESTLDHVSDSTVQVVLSGVVTVPQLSIDTSSPDLQVPLHSRSSTRQILEALEDPK